MKITHNILYNNDNDVLLYLLCEEDLRRMILNKKKVMLRAVDVKR